MPVTTGKGRKAPPPRPRGWLSAWHPSCLKICAARVLLNMLLASALLSSIAFSTSGSTHAMRPHLARSSSVVLSEQSGLAALPSHDYFEAWNARDMDLACAQFSDDCEYEDTQYPGAFSGKEALKSTPQQMRRQPSSILQVLY